MSEFTLDQNAISQEMNKDFDLVKNEIKGSLEIARKAKQSSVDALTKEMTDAQKARTKALKKGRAAETQSNEKIDVGSKDLQDNDSKAGKILKILTLRKTGEDNITNRLKGYSTKSIKNAMEDPKATDTFVKAAERTLDAREKAETAADVNVKMDGRKERQLIDTEGSRHKTFKTLEAIAKQKKIKYKEELDHNLAMVDKALEIGHITERQAKLLKQRIEKIGADAKNAPAKKDLKIPENIVKTAEEIAADLIKNKSKNKKNKKKVKKLKKKVESGEELTEEEMEEAVEAETEIEEYSNMERDLIESTQRELFMEDEYNSEDGFEKQNIDQQAEQDFKQEAIDLC